MASCHLVTDSDLSLLGNIDLGKLHDSIREFIADLDLVKNPLVPCCLFLVGYAVVVDQIPDKGIGILVIGPLGRTDVLIVDHLHVGSCDILAFGNDFNAIKVAYTGTLLALNQDSELVKESCPELLGLCIEFLLCLFSLDLLISLCTLAAAFLGNL